MKDEGGAGAVYGVYGLCHVTLTSSSVGHPPSLKDLFLFLFSFFFLFSFSLVWRPREAAAAAAAAARLRERERDRQTDRGRVIGE